ncbi:hypothetical protein HmCmsJML022_03554 [Escherichia coli]|nr:hypothetical protein HmCmsJML022_03554 [Escherichia coli]
MCISDSFATEPGDVRDKLHQIPGPRSGGTVCEHALIPILVVAPPSGA